MRTETYTSPPSLKENRPVNTSLLTFNLPILIDKMKHSNSWAKGDLDAMVLLKNKDKQIVLTAMHEGTEIYSFQSKGSVTFQIIEGKLLFHTRKESVSLDKGQLLTLYDNIRYSLTSEYETVFLLTMASNAIQSS